MKCDFCGYEVAPGTVECPYCHYQFKIDAQVLSPEERDTFEGVTIDESAGTEETKSAREGAVYDSGADAYIVVSVGSFVTGVVFTLLGIRYRQYKALHRPFSPDAADKASSQSLSDDHVAPSTALLPHTFLHPRKGSAVSPGRAFSLSTKNSTPKPNGVLFFLVLWLSVPLVAQGVDLVGKLGKILVGPALVVLDDAEQPLAGADQPLEHRCGAGRALTGLVLQPDTGAFLQADRTLGPNGPLLPIVRGTGGKALLGQGLGKDVLHLVLAMDDEHPLRLGAERVHPGQ